MAADACTLPTAERPLRLAEFDDLFRQSVVAVDRGALSVRLTLRGAPDLRDRVADLAARETECCSFFAFTLDGDGDGDDDALVLAISVPAARSAILHALAARAAELST